MDLVVGESDPRPADIAFTKNFVPQADVRFWIEDLPDNFYQLILGSGDLPSSCWFLVKEE